MGKRIPFKERIKRRTRVDANGCWIWQGKPGSNGYVSVTTTLASGARWHTSAHRAAYYFLVGPIPEGLVIDHLCRNPVCVNPDHLEPVTQRENALRSPISMATLNSAKTHCPKGHPYDEQNTVWYVNPGGRKTRTRACRTCQRESFRRASQRRRERKAS